MKITKEFIQKLYTWIEKTFLDECGEWFEKWRVEYARYTDVINDSSWYGTRDNSEIWNDWEFRPWLHDLFSDSKLDSNMVDLYKKEKEEARAELNSLIAELYEYVSFTVEESRYFAEMFNIRLDFPESPEEYCVYVCENIHFQEWIYKEIINYLR